MPCCHAYFTAENGDDAVNKIEQCPSLPISFNPNSILLAPNPSTAQDFICIALDPSGA